MPFRHTVHAAQGGTLVPKPPPPAAAQLCASIGGLFAFVAVPTVLWQCADWPVANPADALAKTTALTAQCLADGGVRLQVSILSSGGVGICMTA